MSNLKKAFDTIKPLRMIFCVATVNLPAYTGETKILVQRLWNGKIAVFKHLSEVTHAKADSGYKVFSTEELFWEHVTITSVLIANPDHIELKYVLEEILLTKSE